MSSTAEVAKKFDLYGQYNVFQPWLEENGFTIKDLPLTAKTECDEDVIVDVEKDEETGELIWVISTAQSNGWLRINRYYSDGIVEEMYSR